MWRGGNCRRALTCRARRAHAGARILGRHAGRATVGVAALRLDAAERDMKPRAELHQSAPSAMTRAMSKAVMILPLAPSLMRPRTSMPTSALCTSQAVAQRHADMIDEFQRCRAGAALRAVDHDEIGIDARLQHRLADGRGIPGMADAELEAGGLAAGEPAHGENCIISIGVENAEWRTARCSRRRPHAAGDGDFGTDLGSRAARRHGRAWRPGCLSSTILEASTNCQARTYC